MVQFNNIFEEHVSLYEDSDIQIIFGNILVDYKKRYDLTKRYPSLMVEEPKEILRIFNDYQSEFYTEDVIAVTLKTIKNILCFFEGFHGATFTKFDYWHSNDNETEICITTNLTCNLSADELNKILINIKKPDLMDTAEVVEGNEIKLNFTINLLFFSTLHSFSLFLVELLESDVDSIDKIL